MADSPVLPSYAPNRTGVIGVLNDVLATEIVCWLRYQQHASVAAGIEGSPLAIEFVEQASDELRHALWVTERISQLGGTPDLDPAGMVSRSHTDYRSYTSTEVVDMLKENLLAERIVVETYREIVRWLADDDPTSRHLIERMLEQEENHAHQLRGLLGECLEDTP
jgi:bacterioferritin